eukprot:TRINITY_DN5710_c0_g3_i4.p1 TRINITY_DN5710_c0_g3~~TRINITY_DN5710_c0_g3_i4.p1  ORF type:complete len:133 (+),score=35.24 TRINITY_DN5710_c0_g3_i4:85-483(+)
MCIRDRSMAKMYYKNAEAAILVYDLTQPASFEGLKVWAKELEDNGMSNIVLVVVGNKLDIADTTAINTEEVSDYAESLNATSLTVSAKTDVNIKKIFETISFKLGNRTESSKDSGIKKLTDPSKIGNKKKCC